MHELYKKAVELRYTTTMIEHHNIIGDERSKNANRNADLLLWLGEQVKEVREVFSKHISL